MRQFSSQFLSILKTVPESCVFGVISHSSKQCLISHSNNLSARIGSLIASFPDRGSTEPTDVEVVVFDELDDLEYKLLLCEKYKHQYRLNGYEVLNPRPYINYRVGIRLSKQFKKCLVVLYNKRKQMKVVGAFDKIVEASEFIDQYYANQDVIFPIYSTNEATKEYMKKE